MGMITQSTRSNASKLVDNITFNAVTTTYTSSPIPTSFYRYFITYIDLLSVGTPTYILYEVEFSHDNTNWYKYMNDFCGDLRYEDTVCSTRIYESMSMQCAGRYMRIKVTATGTTAANTFNTNVYIEFYT